MKYNLVRTIISVRHLRKYLFDQQELLIGTSVSVSLPEPGLVRLD